MSECQELQKALDACDRNYGTGSNACDSLWEDLEECRRKQNAGKRSRKGRKSRKGGKRSRKGRKSRKGGKRSRKGTRK